MIISNDVLIEIAKRIGVVFSKLYYLDSIFRMPLKSVLYFLPVFILVSILHRRIVFYIYRNTELDGEILIFRFDFANLILTGSLHVIFIVIISLPYYAMEISNYPEEVYGTIIKSGRPVILSLLYGITIPIWYKTGSKILVALYSLFCIYFLYPSWFVYPYFYMTYLVMKTLWERHKIINLASSKVLFICISTLLLVVGSAYYYFWDFWVEPSMYF